MQEYICSFSEANDLTQIMSALYTDISTKWYSAFRKRKAYPSMILLQYKKML